MHKGIQVDMGKMEYKYEPLDAGLNIRLLVISAGGEDDPIVSSLKSTRLTTSLQYIALSYTWGDQKDRRMITVDGHQFDVTANLHSALRRMRWCGDPRPLWADAICINQDDIQEKQHQVGMMGQIFKQAQVVIADIGEASQDSDLGYDHGLKLYKVLTTMDPSMRLTSVNDYERHGIPPIDDDGWAAWSRLISRPWFTRLWIIQEFALPKGAVMLCGKRPFSYDNIPTTVNLMHKHGLAEYDRPYGDDYALRLRAIKSSQKISTLSFARLAVKDNDSIELLRLLRLVRGCDVTDSRDIVYGLLGIATDVADLNLDIDYSEAYSAPMLYKAVTKKIMQRYNDIDVLYDAERSVALPDFPSWVPNWKHFLEVAHIGLLPDNLHRAYSASGGSQAHLDFRNEDHVLIRGLVFDSITTIGTLMKPFSAEPTSQEAMWEQIITWEKEARGIMSRLKSYPTSCTVLDAYWRTLIADKISSGAKPEPDFYKAYEAACRTPPVTRDEAEFASRPQSLLGFLRFQYHKVFTPASGELYVHPKGRPYISRMHYTIANRHFGLTNKGYMGIYPARTEMDDKIVIIYGARTPFVFRKEKRGYQFIGECYVHGIMDGEAMIGVDPGEQWQDIEVI